MSGILDLKTLLASLVPTLASGEYVFVSHPNANYGDEIELEPIASILEDEGLTLIVPKEKADEANADYQGSFCKITLQVHSSLNAVGLTAAVANALTERNISANVVAAFFHDHIFVPTAQADDALHALNELSKTATQHR